jgi:RNA polymerase sigma-70 factor (ECF subfamily)
LAEDSAQDAFIKAWQNIHRYQPKSPFRSWLYRIATNSAIDRLRRNQKTVDINNVKIKISKPGPEDQTISQERTVIIKNAVLSLPLASRSVIILREYEGLSYREIADTLNIPIGTVMSRLNYARKQLRKKLEIVLEIL